jgi:uncharacterized SAM-binding protein YcdF (DUF218 family)
MRRVGRFCWRAAVALGAVAFAIQVTIGFTGVPSGLQKWLAGQNEIAKGLPRYVVVLGGGGIPSESGLIRTYYAAMASGWQTGTVFVVALPADGDAAALSTGRMRSELVMRGVPFESVRMEFRGRNTREQAINIREMLGPEAVDDALVVITSPSHVRRALLCFRRAGFRNVGGLPAFDVGAEADIGRGTLWRYDFWNNLARLADTARELCALAYYAVRGWI